MEHTIVVVAGADDPAPLQYLAPYSGVAMGEEVMEDGVEVAGQGLVKDALCVYDDLSKHAWATARWSCCFAGRRPQPTRATSHLHPALSAAPERDRLWLADGPAGLETQANDVSAYIPTNHLYHRGHIFLDRPLQAGQRPLHIASRCRASSRRPRPRAMRRSLWGAAESSTSRPLPPALALWPPRSPPASFRRRPSTGDPRPSERGESCPRSRSRRSTALPVERRSRSVGGDKGKLGRRPTRRPRFEAQFYRFHLERKHPSPSRPGREKELTRESRPALQGDRQFRQCSPLIRLR